MNITEHIKKYFKYDSDSGKITRSDRKNSNGSIDKDGYLILKIKGKHFKAHRVAWFLFYGEFPKYEIDHINRIKTDNSIKNLRLANRAMQNLNKNKKGFYIDNSTKGLKKKFTIKNQKGIFRFYTEKEAINFRNKYISEVENEFFRAC